MSRLGCQTQVFRRPVGLLGFQPNLPVVSLFYAFHYIVAHEKDSVLHVKQFLTDSWQKLTLAPNACCKCALGASFRPCWRGATGNGLCRSLALC